MLPVRKLTESNRAVNFHNGCIIFPAYIILLNLPRKFKLRENWTYITGNLHVELRTFKITHVTGITTIVFVSKVTDVYIVAMAMVPTGFLVTIFKLATIFTNIPVVALNYHGYQVYRCSVVFMVKQEGQKCFALSTFSFL